MTNNELNKMVVEIQCSKTFSQLVNLSQSMPVDTNNKNELKTAITTCLMQIVRGLDADRIHFERDEDAALFHGLLTVCLTIVFDGKVPAQEVKWQ